ncbi:MAG: Asp-tRNA(Asn)/Glu-tRNA(Gln) amidotransferase subunit GatC [Bacillota bacterium]|nr:Asp-tRNA(Asn)/Glu-tRNA(Gln) amidotransferase subunit GatC [Bacillota bacterium]MDD3297392.1 Asp-tRNA(Asn)/Glu-tRNA(Gln) amidotransferase subunit GatC [Bacillota bacterium]MDD3850650.1 Asp-tRNA(Asn)/Glu-tRNA(Gln) amidotransferase subunit GatC [Bacillota bacterium]MDD4707103.1 Asp-tRNA(Asn)/Glu-tRNA(Gln) amidotransferase subunit GatC [Bacillota bacterium]
MITKEDVEYVAGLARLELSGQEKEEFTKTLGNILEYVKQLEEVDTSSVQPTAHILPLINVYRDDEVEPSTDRERILANAPEKLNGCFKVPRVI